MDDILKDIKVSECEHTLSMINNFHGNLKFTIEREVDGQLPVLDMKIIHDHDTGRLESTWYRKPTDTGLIMNYHSLAPKRYKRSVVSGFIHRIYRSCSTWKLFHDSLEVVKSILEKNQYPPPFYDPIIKETIDKIVDGKQTTNSQSSREEASEVRKLMVMINYRGKVSEDYARSLHRINAPCNVIMTLRKLKTVLPSLKPSVEKFHKSGVVYKLDCPCCNACYVGQTSRHLLTRFKEHCNRKGPVKSHFLNCKTKLTTENVSILHQTSRGENYLLTMEALYIREHKPTINTKDEYKRRELTLKML